MVQAKNGGRKTARACMGTTAYHFARYISPNDANHPHHQIDTYTDPMAGAGGTEGL